MAPAEADFQKYFHVTPPTVHRIIVQREERGWITRTPRQPRSIHLLLSRKQIPDRTSVWLWMPFIGTEIVRDWELWKPALPTLCHVWRKIPRCVLVASAAVDGSVPMSEKGFASRDIAPCCARTQRQVHEASLCIGAFVSTYVC